MPINPQLLQMILQRQGGMPGGPAPQGMPGAAPVTSPMSKPEPMEGEKMGGMVKVHLAVKILEQAIPMLGAESKEGQAVLKALTDFGKIFGENKEKTNELMPSELMSLVGNNMPRGPQGAPGAPPPPMPGAQQ